ncbi:MAG: PDDEXK nuclease domain-containing protein [Verrucomicrobiota bacterium JB023]|nr:PDDEXK nuclease domain-containing protein [Verrucomicrobiota bacterium JB023]
MNFDQLLTSLRDLDGSLKSHVAQSANVGLTLRNWLVGAYIVEFEQNGEERAEYGERLISEVAKQLQVRGLPPTTLRLCRSLYLGYPEIQQTASVKSRKPLETRKSEIRQTVSGEFGPGILQTLSAIFGKTEEAIPQTLSAEFQRPEFALDFSTLIQKLTFSHFVELLRLDDPLQRAFYEFECIKSGWSVRELKRQIGSLLFERLGLSTDKEKLLRLTAEKSKSQQPADIIKDPYIFEFLGLTPKEAFRENDLETLLLDHLQEFLLELGNGFCFEDRQKKIRIGSSDYFVDLVFYHRKLHCHVLIELKVEPFNHANAGQLNTYLNYYQKHEMATGDNPPIGLLLCTDKDHTLVEYALGGMDENLFVSAYKVALPKPEELEAFLVRQSKDLPES